VFVARDGELAPEGVRRIRTLEGLLRG
jgi:hypothetical protein